MAVTSAKEFFATLEKSKLLTPSQLAQARRAAGPDDDPTAIAKQLVHLEIITRWQAGQLLAGRSSFYLGKYRLVELLGRGGVGGVFLGQHVAMNRRVALKILPRKVGEDPAALDRFLAEARALAALDHPNFIHIYNIDNEGDRYYLVMEYIEGVDLQHLVEEYGPLDCGLAADYIRQAADGLDHAHGRNMIHGDVKPSNLLVDLQGVVKILDLGLTRLAGGQNQRVSNATRYLAPEQSREGAAPSVPADIYALGGSLYFLLKGHPPLAQGAPAGPTVPADLAAICQKMMAPRPEDRYPTAADVARALAQWQTSSPPPKPVRPLPVAKRLEE